MKRLVSFPAAGETYQKFDAENRRKLPDDFFAGAGESGYLLKEDQTLGYYAVDMLAGVPVLSAYMIENLLFADAFGLLAALSEACIRRYHPQKILAKYNDYEQKLWNANGYYQKGRYMQKNIEPWRYLLKDMVFDPEGYIIDQGSMSAIPYGWFNSMAKGCGWIACYNLLKMCGKEQTMQETAEELGRRVILGAVAGQELYTTYIYLKGKGVNCRLSLSLDHSAIACMKKSRYGILLYSHRQGAHYTAFRNLGNGRMQFYNAVYARVDHQESPEGFLQQRELLPFSSVIYVE